MIISESKDIVTLVKMKKAVSAQIARHLKTNEDVEEDTTNIEEFGELQTELSKVNFRLKELGVKEDV